MPEFLAVAKVGDIPEGEGRSYPVAGKMLAIFLTDGEYSAIDDTCPHMGASLASGWVEGNAVTCPWHAWRFCIKQGTWLDNPNPKVSVATYEVRVEGDDVLVEVPKPQERSDARWPRIRLTPGGTDFPEPGLALPCALSVGWSLQADWLTDGIIRPEWSVPATEPAVAWHPVTLTGELTVTRMTFAAMSLIGAIPGGYLSFRLVMAMLQNFANMVTMMRVVVCLILLLSALMTVLPVGILIFVKEEKDAKAKGRESAADEVAETADADVPATVDDTGGKSVVMDQTTTTRVEMSDDFIGDMVEAEEEPEPKGKKKKKKKK